MLVRVGLEINEEKTKHMLLSCQQNTGQNHGKKIANRCFENVTQFKYLGTTAMNQNLIQEKIMMRLNSGDDYYRSAQNILSSHLPSTNIKIRLYKIIILHVVLYRCEIWSLILREKHKLKVF
jgi:hypothetical protein